MQTIFYNSKYMFYIILYFFKESTAAVCQSINSTNAVTCEKGATCPFRHIRGDRTIVCKHWLRGLCKKGDQCEFLHEFDMKKMPECYFYSRFNACHNKECPFLHIDPESKIKDCPWYDRGFCRHGPHCRHRHLRRVLCLNYLAGFCPDGWNCKYMHPSFELPPFSDVSKENIKKLPTCHSCGETGHKASACRKAQSDIGDMNVRKGLRPQDIRNTESMDVDENHTQQLSNIPNTKMSKPLEDITCYKCGNKGHYANKCPKGHLAFLSNQHSYK